MKKEMKKEMKKVLALLLALVLVLSLAACGGGSNYSTSSRTSTWSNEKESDELTDAEIKIKVERAILDEVKSRYKAADPYSTRYRISNTETKGNYIYVYGTVTLYDKYGQITTGHPDGSGSYSRTFEVKLGKNGGILDCTVE